jgi:hypothetical protein
MIKYFYFFTVKYWDEISETMRTEKGFTRALTYSEVAADIASWYGEDNIEKIHIDIVEDGDGPLTVSMIIDTLDSNLHKHEVIDDEEM